MPSPSPTRTRCGGFTPREHGAALLVFVAVTIAFFFPLLKGDTFSNIDRRQNEIYPWASLDTGRSGPPIHYDLAEWAYPLQVFTSQAVRDGEIPLWDPHSFGGHPFLANGSSGVLYPPRLVLSLALSPARVHDALLVTHLFFAGVAMFLLLGAVRLSFAASLLGGLAWMVNSYALSWQFLEHYIAIEVWLPVGALLAHLAVRRRSWPAAFGLALALGLMFFAGNVLFVELAVVAIFGYGLTLTALDAWRDRASLRGNVLRLGTGAALAAGMSAVTSLSTLALAANTARRAPTFEELGRFALPFADLRHLVVAGDFVSDPYHQNLFAGTAIAVLAIVGLAGRHVLARFSAAAAALTVLFMLHTPVTLAVNTVLPGFESFKPLARAAFLLQFALAVLAAFGLDVVRRVARRHAPALTRRLRPRQAAVVASALPVLAFVILAGSVLGQEYKATKGVRTHQPNQERLLFPATPLIRFLQEDADARFIATDSAFLGSTALVHELESVGGYDNLAPRRTEDFWRVLGGGWAPAELEAHALIYAFYPEYAFAQLRPHLLARAGVRYVVTPPRTGDGQTLPAGLVPRYDGQDGRVFSVAGVLPRAYVVGACEQAPTALSALERFVAADFRAGETVVLESPDLERASLSCAGGSTGRAGSAVVLERTLNSMHVHVQATREAWLVVTETWDRDWRATIGDRSVEVLPANYAQRGVRVPAGTHSVRFTYEPAAFRAGLLLATSCLLAAVAGLAVPVVRRGRVGRKLRADGADRRIRQDVPPR